MANCEALTCQEASQLDDITLKRMLYVKIGNGCLAIRTYNVNGDAAATVIFESLTQTQFSNKVANQEFTPGVLYRVVDILNNGLGYNFYFFGTLLTGTLAGALNGWLYKVIISGDPYSPYNFMDAVYNSPGELFEYIKCQKNQNQVSNIAQIEVLLANSGWTRHKGVNMVGSTVTLTLTANVTLENYDLSFRSGSLVTTAVNKATKVTGKHSGAIVLPADGRSLYVFGPEATYQSLGVFSPADYNVNASTLQVAISKLLPFEIISGYAIRVIETPVNPTQIPDGIGFLTVGIDVDSQALNEGQQIELTNATPGTRFFVPISVFGNGAQSLSPGTININYNSLSQTLSDFTAGSFELYVVIASLPINS